MTDEELLETIAKGESLSVEFKSDFKKELSDADLVAAVVCMTNTTAGVILVGVEDDGEFSGLHPSRSLPVDVDALRSLIRSRTTPNVETKIRSIVRGTRTVVVIEVPRTANVVARADGLCVRRIIGANGPECIPYLPREHGLRGLSLGSEDFTAQPCTSTQLDDLDKLQIERGRRVIAAQSGDKVLLGLSDEDLVKAVQCVLPVEGRLVPTYAGLIMFGKEEVLSRILPTHRTAYQVLTEQRAVQVNEFETKPMIEVVGSWMERFARRVQQRERMVGAIRVAVPEYSAIAFREAILNALLHRDFTKMGIVQLQWFDDRMEIINPGGFPEGVNASNVLTHQPTPRNQRLYDVARRLGLVEQTGRGVDRVYDGQLRYGRPAPDYSGSTSLAVRLVLHGGHESLQLAAFVFDRDTNARPLTVEDLIVINRLFYSKRATLEQLAVELQRSVLPSSSITERLVEEDLIVGKGEGPERVFTLSARVYSFLGKPEAFARTGMADLNALEPVVMQLAKARGPIKRGLLMELYGLTGQQAHRLLARMVDNGQLVARGERKGRRYLSPDSQ